MNVLAKLEKRIEINGFSRVGDVGFLDDRIVILANKWGDTNIPLGNNGNRNLFLRRYDLNGSYIEAETEAQMDPSHGEDYQSMAIISPELITVSNDAQSDCSYYYEHGKPFFYDFSLDNVGEHEFKTNDKTLKDLIKFIKETEYISNEQGILNDRITYLVRSKGSYIFCRTQKPRLLGVDNLNNGLWIYHDGKRIHYNFTLGEEAALMLGGVKEHPILNRFNYPSFTPYKDKLIISFDAQIRAYPLQKIDSWKKLNVDSYGFEAITDTPKIKQDEIKYPWMIDYFNPRVIGTIEDKLVVLSRLDQEEKESLKLYNLNEISKKTPFETLSLEDDNFIMMHDNPIKTGVALSEDDRLAVITSDKQGCYLSIYRLENV